MSVQPPLIDAATIADVAAAVRDATSNADRGAAQIAELCLRAANEANAGGVATAKADLRRAMAEASDPRLLFLGFQFFFRTAVAEGNAGDERDAGLRVAEELVRRRLKIVEERCDLGGVGRALTNLGLVLHYQHRYAEAEEHYRRAVDTDRASGDTRGLVRSLGNLGNFYETRSTPASEDDLVAAEGLYREAVEIAERAGSPHLAAGPTANLGDLYLTRGDRVFAKLFWRQALSLVAEADVKVRVYCERRLSENA